MSDNTLFRLIVITLVLFLIYLVVKSRHEKQKKKRDHTRRFRGK